MKRVYVLFFLDLASRRILFTACSEHVGGAWAALQARNLAWQLQNARCERWVSSVRCECLDWLLIVNRRHRRRFWRSITGTDLIAAWVCNRRVGAM